MTIAVDLDVKHQFKQIKNHDLRCSKEHCIKNLTKFEQQHLSMVLRKRLFDHCVAVNFPIVE